MFPSDTDAPHLPRAQEKYRWVRLKLLLCPPSPQTGQFDSALAPRQHSLHSYHRQETHLRGV